ncbi:MAG: hypothetical protein U0Z53_29025 [Blastocatellia bacterium]
MPNPENSQPLYDFASDPIEVHINLTPKADFKTISTHRLRKRTLDQVRQRERAITMEEREVNRKESEFLYDDEAANLAHYDALIVAANGYDLDGSDPDGTRFIALAGEENDQVRALIPVQHKLAVIAGLDTARAELLQEEGRAFRLGGDRTQRVRLRKGQYELIFTMQEGDERKRKRYTRSMQIRQVRGSRKGQKRFVSDLQTVVDLFDAQFIAVTGGELQGEQFRPELRSAFLSGIDPIDKRAVIDALYSELEAELQD